MAADLDGAALGGGADAMHDARGLLPLGLGKQGHEHAPAEPGRSVGAAHQAGDDVGKQDDGPVPDLEAPGVVDLRQAVEIHHHDGVLAVVSQGAFVLLAMQARERAQVA